MSKWLCKVTEEYRCDSDSEAMEIIEEAKQNGMYELKKYTNDYKERKAKGEVVDAYHLVSLVKVFNDPKEPAEKFSIEYSGQ